VATFLQILGEAEVPPEQLEARFQEIAERHVEQDARLRALDSDDPEVAALRHHAADAHTRGEYDAADALLAEADAADARAISAHQALLEAERAADMIRGRPLLPASNAPVGMAEGWESRQRSRAPARRYVDQAA
jgi:hypothetical protein